MNIAGPFIRRPVMTTLLMLSILLFGIMAYRQLPVSDLPNVDYPTLQVSASLPGASPETMASAVATVLEKQFSTIAGIDSMTSQSGQGSTQITLQFALSRDIDSAAQDVQAAIARASRLLPRDMPTPPTYQKVNPADDPILYVALTSPTLPLSELDEYGQTLIAQRVSMVDGVAQVQVFGSQKFAVRIQVDPGRLFARGLSVDEVIAAVRRGNVNKPTGVLYGPERTMTVQADGQLTRAEQYKPLIVAYRDGAPVRLEDVATVFDGVENDKLAAWYCANGRQQRAIMLAVQRQPGQNTVEVAGQVRALLGQLRARLPASVDMQIMFDSSRPIEESYADVRFTLILTLVLVVLVIFVFLRNLSATVIPSLSLPMSLVGTFIAMRLLDYSLDNLSLMALTLAIGFVVDDAIVVLENIVRHMDTGKTRLQAALDATREIGFTVVSMTVSLAAVFIPVLFMGGLVGRIFREFAVTIGVAVLVSGVVALTLIPMLAARFLRASSATRHGQAHGAGRGIGVSLYGRSLWWVLRHGPLTMVVAALTLALTVVLFRTIPKGFVPTEDRGYFRGQTEAAEGTSHVSMFRRQQAVAAVLQQDPAVDAFMSRAGSIGGRTTNAGGFFVRLKPRSERKESAEQIIQRLRPRFGAIPGVRVFAQSPAIIQVGGRMSRSQYQYTLMGPDTDDLYRYGAALQERFQTFPGFLDVNSDVQLKNPELTVEINRDLAATLGVSAEQIEDTLLAAYGSSQVSTIFAPNNQYQVIVEFPPELQLNAEALSLLHVRSDSGRLVPLRVLAELRTEVGPLSINHSGQLPSVTLSFNLQPGTSIGEAIGRIEKAAREILPPTVSGSFQGTAQTFQSSLRDMGMLLILAIVVIYMVLGVLYENFYHPVTILSALPFAGLGALLALQMAGAELSIYAFVGIIMLVGLVKKNGIMMVDFAIEAQRSEGKPPTEAIHQACMVRFRPIMMTTVAALMAGLPIALGFGAGAESRRPLGLAVVGGLLFSQTLTLYVTPVFYLYMDRLQTWVRTRAATPESAPVGVAARE